MTWISDYRDEADSVFGAVVFDWERAAGLMRRVRRDFADEGIDPGFRFDSDGPGLRVLVGDEFYQEFEPGDDDYRRDLEKLRARLDELDRKSRDEASRYYTRGTTVDVRAEANPTINFNPVNNVTVTATATSYADACAALGKVDGLDDELMRELRGLMNELDGAKDEGTAKHIAKKLADTAIERGADALPVVAPFVAQALKSALGMQ